MSKDPRDFGRKPYIDRGKEEEAAITVAFLCILGALLCFLVGYWIDDINLTSFAFLVGVGLLLVAWAAAWDAVKMDEEEF